jgi:hypothetical protein
VTAPGKSLQQSRKTWAISPSEGKFDKGGLFVSPFDKVPIIISKTSMILISISDLN